MTTVSLIGKNGQRAGCGCIYTEEALVTGPFDVSVWRAHSMCEWSEPGDRVLQEALNGSDSVWVYLEYLRRNICLCSVNSLYSYTIISVCEGMYRTNKKIGAL